MIGPMGNGQMNEGRFLYTSNIYLFLYLHSCHNNTSAVILLINFLKEYSKFNNRRQMNATDRALIAAFREITSMADRLHLEARTVDKAKANFKEVYESRSLKGRSNDAIAAACLYIACRQEAVPRTFKVFTKRIIGSSQ